MVESEYLGLQHDKSNSSTISRLTAIRTRQAEHNAPTCLLTYIYYTQPPHPIPYPERHANEERLRSQQLLCQPAMQRVHSVTILAKAVQSFNMKRKRARKNRKTTSFQGSDIIIRRYQAFHLYQYARRRNLEDPRLRSQLVWPFSRSLRSRLGSRRRRLGS
jgi:hypothetical protein